MNDNMNVNSNVNSNVKYVENSLTELDERFIAEALEAGKQGIHDKQENSRKIFRWTGRLSKVAVACAAVIGVAVIGVSAYATVRHLQSTKVQDGYIYVGGTPENIGVISDEDTDKYNEYEEDYKVLSHETGDDGAVWTSKEVRKYSDGKVTYYFYKNYGDAVTDQDVEEWFTDLPGEPIQIKAGYSEYDYMDCIRITAEYKYQNGTYTIDECKMILNGGTTVSDDFGICIEYDKSDNSREYTNAAGVKFTLVDGSNYNEATGEYDTETVVMILKENTDGVASEVVYQYNGFVTFKGLSDKEIHKVLDCFGK